MAEHNGGGGGGDENLATRLGPLSALTALVGLAAMVWLFIKHPRTAITGIVLGVVIGSILVLMNTSISTMNPLIALLIVVSAAYFLCRND